MRAKMDVDLRDITDAADGPGLVLFLGAGVNGDRYPMWKELVGLLLRDGLRSCMRDVGAIKALKKRLETWDIYAQATLAKVLLGDRYTDVLRNHVYCAKATGVSHVHQVAKFCRHRQVKAVVTYNYDTHLESAFRACAAGSKRKMVPIGLSGRDSHEGGKDVLPVYHVHGLLACSDELHKTFGDPVVLTYDEYGTSMRDTANWAAATQIHFLRSHSCLFLGASMTDWNLLRLLQATCSPAERPRHWTFGCKGEFTSEKDVKLGELAWRAKLTLLESMGVKAVMVGEGYHHIYEALDDIPGDDWATS